MDRAKEYLSLEKATRARAAGRSVRMSELLFHEEDAVVVARPVVHDFFHLQACGSELFDYNFLGNPVSTAVCGDAFDRFEARASREVDNCEMSTGFQRADEAGVKLVGLGEVMVDAAEEDGVAAGGGQCGVGFLAFYSDDVAQIASCDFGTEVGKFLRVDLRGDD